MKACCYVQLKCSCGEVRIASDSAPVENKRQPIECPKCHAACQDWRLLGLGMTARALPFVEKWQYQ